MLGILRQLGARPAAGAEAGVAALDLPLWRDVGEIPDSPVGKFIKHVAKAETTVVHPMHR